jgi:alpha,alpha-trehalase
MHELMWDDERGFFFDYDWVNERRNPHPSLAGFFPLWAGLATSEQAARMVREWLPQFERPGGLVTTLEERAGRQWASPNGWAPLQWIAVAGLERYGYHAAAQRIRHQWCENCAAVFAATGAMWEKYNVVEPGVNPEEGLYGSVAGFGWSHAVFVDFSRHLTMASTASQA